ncbi:Transcription factor bHLH36 [Linum grandiflorum]
MDHNSLPSTFTFRPPPPVAAVDSNLEANNHQQPVSLPARSRRRKSTEREEKEEEAKGNEEEEKEKRKLKKMMHADVEKQRRLEMSRLCSSLRTFLPIEYLKGKRSVSDHIHQAANYIKHQEEKIKELKVKRDELEKTCNVIPTTTGNSSASASNSSANNHNHDEDEDKSAVIISVTTCLIGIEVTLEICEFSVGVSTIVGALADEGLNVVSCISARVNHGMVYTIKAEVRCKILRLIRKFYRFRGASSIAINRVGSMSNVQVCDGRSIDVAQLQEKLSNSLAPRRSAPDKTAGSS